MKPRVGFIIPLRAPETTSNWQVVSYNCKRTLNSVLKSTDSNFDVVLICHKPPDQLKKSNHLTVIKVDFPIPAAYGELLKDKGRKIIKGAQFLRKKNFEYLMALDADDFIHRKLVEWVVDQEIFESGFRISDGWVYGGGFIARKQPNFDRMCGSSIIHRDIAHESCQ